MVRRSNTAPSVNTGHQTRFGPDPTSRPACRTSLQHRPVCAAESKNTGDLVHRASIRSRCKLTAGRWTNLRAISDAAGLTMGYYDTGKLPLYKPCRKVYARRQFLSHTAARSAARSSIISGWSVTCSPTWPDIAGGSSCRVDARRQDYDQG